MNIIIRVSAQFISREAENLIMKRGIDSISGGGLNPGAKRNAGEENVDGDVSSYENLK